MIVNVMPEITAVSDAKAASLKEYFLETVYFSVICFEREIL
jgi:hypothetical protein